jgi:hypothetical protein
MGFSIAMFRNARLLRPYQRERNYPMIALLNLEIEFESGNADIQHAAERGSRARPQTIREAAYARR